MMTPRTTAYSAIVCPCSRVCVENHEPWQDQRSCANPFRVSRSPGAPSSARIGIFEHATARSGDRDRERPRLRARERHSQPGPFGGDVAALDDATRDETSLRRFLHGLPGVDQVGAEARAAALATRSIKTTSKAWALDDGRSAWST